jgi:hypothetical protein
MFGAAAPAILKRRGGDAIDLVIIERDHLKVEDASKCRVQTSDVQHYISKCCGT